MKKPRIEDLLMSRLFVPRKDLDPNDWQTHVRRNIVHEVRAETVRFYGPTDCLEAQYPGLDYSRPAHRLRLSHFPYHRRLFKAFDQLRMTDNEIQKLCNWEGTRYAREAYEANNKMKIRETTWEGIINYADKPTTATKPSLRGGHVELQTEPPPYDVESDNGDDEMEDSNGEEEGSEEESEDEMQQSVGVELNQRLLAATEARARGEDVIIDADWEQWLKEAAERGARSNMSQLADSASTSTTTPQIPVYWSHGTPEYVSDNPTPEIAAIQASLPPPPQYFPRENSNALSTTVLIPPPPPRTGTTS